MHKPTVSILTVAYNQENYISKCIESVVLQNVDFNIEMIIGEDCSTDGTRLIIEEYAEKYPSIVKPIYNITNNGGRINYINVVKNATGKYTAHLDGDDYMLPDKLRTQVAYMEANPDVVMSGHNVRIEDGECNFIKNNNDFFKIKTGGVNDLLRFGTYMANTSVMYRREFLDIDLFDRLHKYKYGDWLLHLIVARNGKVGYLDNILSVYRRHAMGVTSIGNKSIENRLVFLEAQLEILKSAEKMGLNPAVISEVSTKLYFNTSMYMLKNSEIKHFGVFLFKSITVYLPKVISIRLLLASNSLTYLLTNLINLSRNKAQ